MNEVKLYNRIKEGYNATTHNHNSFKRVVKSINWDCTFTEDDELYYMLNGFSLSVGCLNPFEEKCKPCIIFSDCSMVNLRQLQT